MSKKSENLAEQVLGHSDEAKQLLKEATNVQRLNSQGMIEEDEAAEKVMSLNEQAIEETEKAIELQKEFIAEQEDKSG